MGTNKVYNWITSDTNALTDTESQHFYWTKGIGLPVLQDMFDFYDDKSTTLGDMDKFKQYISDTHDISQTYQKGELTVKSIPNIRVFHDFIRKSSWFSMKYNMSMYEVFLISSIEGGEAHDRLRSNLFAPSIFPNCYEHFSNALNNEFWNGTFAVNTQYGPWLTFRYYTDLTRVQSIQKSAVGSVVPEDGYLWELYLYEFSISTHGYDGTDGGTGTGIGGIPVNFNLTNYESMFRTVIDRMYRYILAQNDTKEFLKHVVSGAIIYGGFSVTKTYTNSTWSTQKTFYVKTNFTVQGNTWVSNVVNYVTMIRNNRLKEYVA